MSGPVVTARNTPIFGVSMETKQTKDRQMKKVMKITHKYFPNAKYIESENLEFEDDYIQLNDDYHIQICFFGGGFALWKENKDETFTTYGVNEKYKDALKKAHELKNKG